MDHLRQRGTGLRRSDEDLGEIISTGARRMYDWPGAALVAGGILLTAATTVLAIDNPEIAIGTAAATIILLCLLRRLDGWQRLLAMAMFLLLASASDLPALAQLTFYPRYLAIAGLICWAHVATGRRSVRLDRYTQLFVIALYTAAGLATLSSLWSLDVLHTLQQGIALMLLAALVHVLVVGRWADRAVMLRDLAVVYVMLSASLVLSLGYGLVNSGNTNPYDQRFQGLYGNANMLGLICSLTIPLGWAVYRHSRNRLHLLGLVPAVIALVLSQSRTALVAVLVGALWIVLRHGGRTLARVVTVAAAAFAVGQLFNAVSLVINAAWVQDFARRFSEPGSGDVSNGRLETWQATIHLWQTRPAFGYGYAAGPQLFEQNLQAGFFNIRVGMVHNSYLQWLLETGIAGLVPLVLLVFAALRALWYAPMEGANPGFLWLIAACLVIQLSESAMFATGLIFPYLFWPIVAAVLTTIRAPDGEAPATPATAGAAGPHSAPSSWS